MPDIRLWWESLRFVDPAYFILFDAVAGLFAAVALIIIHKFVRRPKKSKSSRYKLLGIDFKWVGAAFICLVSVFALARPQVSGGYTVNYGGNVRVAVAFDKSASMKSGDLKPSRHAVAVRTVTDLVDSGIFIPGDKITLFTFAGHSNWRMPFSEDLEDFKVKLAEIEHPEVYQEESQLYTDLAKVLEHIPECVDKQDNFFKKGGRVLNASWPPDNTIVLLISDGDDWENTKLDPAVRELKKRKIKVFSVGIGTRTPTEVTFRAYNPDFPEDVTKIEQVKIKTALNTKRLKEIADKTGGEMYIVDSASSSVGNSLQYAVNSNRSHIPHLTYSDKRRDIWWDILTIGGIIIGSLMIVKARG